MLRFRLGLYRCSACRLAAAVLLSAVVLAAGAAEPTARAAEPFPFGSELMLDAAPMHGSRRVPMIEIEDDGTASIDLWCASLKAQATVNAAALTIVPGDAPPAQCDPDRQARDADLLAALTQVTGWRRSGEVIELTGAAPLRFHLMTN
jgi:heat shock protein HslJ